MEVIVSKSSISSQWNVRSKSDRKVQEVSASVYWVHSTSTEQTSWEQGDWCRLSCQWLPIPVIAGKGECRDIRLWVRRVLESAGECWTGVKITFGRIDWPANETSYPNKSTDGWTNEFTEFTDEFTDGHWPKLDINIISDMTYVYMMIGMASIW